VTRLAVISLNSPRIVTGIGPAARPAAASVPRPRHWRDPRLRTVPSGPNALPLAGQSGHSSTAVLRAGRRRGHLLAVHLPVRGRPARARRRRAL